MSKTATIDTEKGTITAELFDTEVPGTVANFEKLANSEFYDGTRFHRVINNFMIQGGDPLSKTANHPRVGSGGPGYTIKCETSLNTHKHVAGTLSMAHAGKDTGGSQFFICHSPQSTPRPGPHCLRPGDRRRHESRQRNPPGRCHPLNPGELTTQVDLALLCDYALLDQQGKLSVLGIWRHVAVQQFPAMHPRAHLVLHLRGRRTELGNHELRVRLVDPEGEVALEQTGMMQINEPPAGVVDLEAPAVLVFDLPLAAAGEYAFVVSVDQIELARVAFQATMVGAHPGGTVH